MSIRMNFLLSLADTFYSFFIFQGNKKKRAEYEYVTPVKDFVRFLRLYYKVLLIGAK